MIKEKKKKGKYHSGLTLKKELLGYIRTGIIAFLIAGLITLLLSFHARSEMIKNLYTTKEQKNRLDRKIAQEITSQTDLTASLQDKDYKVCMYVGGIYEAAENYPKAEYAYTLALKKAPINAYNPYYKLSIVLIAQEKFKEAQELINSVNDAQNINMIKFKTRAYIVMGDKYNSINKYLKAAECYEKADYYYNHFVKKDKTIDKSIKIRLANAYIDSADVFVANGYNSDAVNFLNKALKYKPDDNLIQYKLAIIYVDLDPIKAIEYFDILLDKIPQKIDYDTYNRALIKAANIADIKGDTASSKYYRYKLHSNDLFVKNKVVYKNDIEVLLSTMNIKKALFGYHLNTKFKFINVSAMDLNKLYAEFVLKNKNEKKESIVINCANKQNILRSNGGATTDINVVFSKNIFTKKELENYVIEVYLYKDKKFKTFSGAYKVITK